MRYALLALCISVCSCGISDDPDDAPYSETKEDSTYELDIANDVSTSSVVSVPKHSIVKDENLHHFKRSVDVRIPIRYTETQLNILAKHIKNLDKGKYDRTFILYYLPHMEIDAGAWASSHYNPNLEVRIYGLSVEKYKQLTSLPENLDSSSEIIGRWAHMIALFDIYSKDNNYFIRTTYSDGSNGQENLQKRTIEGETRYYVLDSDFGEYFVVSSRGELKAFDKDGFIESYGMSITGTSAAQAQPVSVAPAQRPPTAEVATIDTVQTPIEATIEVSVTELPNKSVQIRGTTNLPTGTHLMLTIIETIGGGNKGQSKSSVAADGSFEAGPFTAGDGFEDGIYVVEVSMPIPSVQPDNVKKIIGADGEMLSGPLVEKGVLGVTLSKTKEFTIGGEQAAQAQQERIDGRIKVYEEWLKKIVALHARLQAAIPSSQKPDASWNKFAQEFNIEIQSLKVQAMEIELESIGGFMIYESLEYIRQMFHSTAFAKEDEYNKASNAYQERLKELEQYIADTKSGN